MYTFGFDLQQIGDVFMENKELEKKIIDVARTVFVHSGYSQASMSEIAEAVGINRPTLHYYFRTKEKLFNEIFGGIIRESVEQIRCILQEELPLRERLRHIVDSYYRHFIQYPDLPMFFLREIQRDPAKFVEEVDRGQVHGLLHDVMEIYDRYIEEKKIRNVPFYIFLPSFYMLLITPFLGRKLMDLAPFRKSVSQEEYLDSWKAQIVEQMAFMLGIGER